MQLIHHAYSHKPDRYFIDGRRVSEEAFDLVRLQASIAQGPHECFLTRARPAPAGTTHYVHYSSLRPQQKGTP